VIRSIQVYDKVNCTTFY